MSIFYKSKKKIQKINEKGENSTKLESKIKNNYKDANITKTSIIKQPDMSIDDNLPSTVTLLRTPDGGKCYLVGTAHFSIESQNEVAKIIQATQPHIVTVELCLDRIEVLKLDEKTILEESTGLSLNDIVPIIRKNGIKTGLIFLLSFKILANLSKTLDLAPGGEFRRALIEVKKVPNCLIHMGDRPIKVTFGRALSFLTWWQIIKIALQLLTQNITISQKDIEKYKCRDLIEEFMVELAEEYPALEKVFVKERDIYLTYSLQLACKPKIGKFGKLIPARVVGIVGIGHTFGIVQNWGKVKQSQIPKIMSIPPPSLSSTILLFTIKAYIFGTIIYVVYKFIPILTSIILFLKSTVEGFTKVVSYFSKLINF